MDDYPQSRVDSIIAAYEATVAGLTGTTATVNPGSVNIVMSTPVASTDAYNTASASVASSFNNLATINSALGVDALSTPVVVARIQRHALEGRRPLDQVGHDVGHGKDEGITYRGVTIEMLAIF